MTCTHPRSLGALQCRACHDSARRTAITFNCQGCGQSVSRKKRGRDARLFCSKVCAGAWHRARTAERVEIERRKRRAELEIRRAEKRVAAKDRNRAKVRIFMRRKYAAFRAANPLPSHVFTCVRCGNEFMTNRARYRKFCSRQCAQRAHASDHCERAKRYGGARTWTITSAVVFDMAGWRCQICETETPRELTGSHSPNAPELDHIIPLSKGGGHTWDNVQCACRQCNSKKRALVPSAEERRLWASRTRPIPDHRAIHRPLRPQRSPQRSPRKTAHPLPPVQRELELRVI